MPQLLELSAGDRMPTVSAGPLTPAITTEELQRDKPDRHLMLLSDSSELLARASVWWNETPIVSTHRAGLIGHYGAADAESGLRVIEEACRRLERARCTIGIAPMDGNTWRRYRFVTERGTEPPFFLEPGNPDAWPVQFVSAGFDVLATYTSAMTGDLGQEDPRLLTAMERLKDRGVVIRPLNIAQAEEELRRIYTLSLASFERNYLYTPIAEEEFLEQNRRILPFVTPDLVLLAEQKSTLVGFLFAVPDVLQRQRGVAVDTIIIKTVAVLPGSTHAGLGSVLVGLAQRRARELGFCRAIHALMHEQNVSRNISRRYARTIRRYSLFSRLLPNASSA